LQVRLRAQHGDGKLPEDYTEESEIRKGSTHRVVGDRSHYVAADAATLQVILDQLLIVGSNRGYRPKAEKNRAHSPYSCPVHRISPWTRLYHYPMTNCSLNGEQRPIAAEENAPARDRG